MTHSNLIPNHRHFLPALALALPFIFTSPIALSDDIEVYLQEPPVPAPPNMLFVLDESGSMASTVPGTSESRRDQLVRAMKSLVNDPEMGNVNTALLGYTTTGWNVTSRLIARSGDFKLIEGNQTTFSNQLDLLTNDFMTPTVAAMEAAINWFRRDVVFTDNGGTTRTSPLEGDPDTLKCAPNYIVLLSDGNPNTNSMTTYNGTICANNAIGTGGTCANEIAAWGFNTDLETGTEWDDTQNIITHTLGLDTSAGTSTFLRGVASAGGGSYYGVNNATDMTAAFSEITRNAQSSVNYAFNAPTIPFNPDNAAVSSDEIFIPMFKPANEIFWRGNLKKYTISVTDEAVVLKALNDEDVLDPDTSAFLSTRDLFCDGDPCVRDEGDPLVGGAARDMQGTRNLYTNLNSGLALNDTANRVHRNTAAITQAMLGVATDEDRTDLLNWITRDSNWTPIDEEASHVGVMGAPIHTQPTVVEYTSDESVVYIPTSEGVLEAIDASTGNELWAFMPSDLLANIRTIKNNEPSVIPYYGLDGPLTIYKTGTQTMAIFGMRRGGSKYHLLNITDRLAPEYVTEISSADSDFSKLGQTWSKPLFVKMMIDSVSKEVLVFGGGYDPDQDDSTLPDSEGNAIYIVDAEDGSFEKSISNANADLNIPGMTYAIPSDLATIDIDGNGEVDRIYAADVGGRIVRVDIENLAGGIVADINDGSPHHRKFFNTPQIGYYSKGGVQFLSILIGTGDVANPLDDSFFDRFYMIKDTAIWHTPDPFVTATATNFLNASPAALDRNEVLNVANKGWYVDFTTAEKSFSRAILYDYDIFFTTYSAETVLPENICEATGTVGAARIYGLDLIDAGAVIKWDPADETPLTVDDRIDQLGLQGIPPSPMLLFPGGEDDDGNTVIGKKIFLFSDLKKKREWGDRFRPIYWEEVIDE
ncbi:MAG: PQQ-binding-like beta-propeller repeat protein [Candidatus Thiodiazotropha sp. (ex Rostrolucina anterorostrata)]|nr:PQQ-binding-like beta-propeller repeat protein [Candidatus Thiodiazotropha sp. (ex Rostrolucina anterorostrata)]